MNEKGQLQLKTYATYLQNSSTEPLKYGKINLINPPRQRLRGEEPKPGIRAVPVFAGFCGTDRELMHMGRERRLSPKFPEGEKRLINGHEGVVWIPEEQRFAIVLIRGGDSCDPTRFTDDESYFEYGCDQADGLFCDEACFHPDMLLRLPPEYDSLEKLPLSLAKKLVFSDPYACAIFQHERMCDIGEAQYFRVEMAKYGCGSQIARSLARETTFERTVIFGLGTTGLFIGDQIRRHHPNANLLFVARSPAYSEKAAFARETVGAEYLSTDRLTEEQTADQILERLGGRATVFIGTSGTELEHRIAFERGVLGCNGIYNSFSLGPRITFDTMPFGFQNHVILSSINFTQKHMEEAIGILCESNFDQLVRLIDKDEFIQAPMEAYETKIFSKAAPLKTAVIWNSDYIDPEK